MSDRPTPNYNLASVNAEAIAAICNKATALEIWNAQGVSLTVRDLDKEFRQLAERLGYTVAVAE